MLDKILDFIAEHLGIDSIVEQGNNDIWEYRKWRSGRLEMWGTVGFNITRWTQWGQMYYSNSSPKHAFPLTFTAPPNVYVTDKRNREEGIAYLADTATTATEMSPLAILRPLPGNTGYRAVSVYVVGKWNTGGVLNEAY